MKLKKLGLFLIMASVAVFSACSDDDDKGPAEDLAVEIEGNYFGSLDVKVGDDASEPSSNFIFLKRTAKNEVELKLESFSFGEIQLKDAITLGGIKLDGKSQDVVLKENKQDIKLDLGGESITATVVTNGTVKGKELNLTLDIDASGLKVAVTFKGDLVGEVATILYDMEEWEPEWKNGKEIPIGMASSNQGSSSIFAAGKPGITKSDKENTYNGQYSAKIETLRAKGSGNLIPVVTSGSLFTGFFRWDMMAGLRGEALKMTEFGIGFEKGQPLQLSGYFKYKAGAEYLRVPEGGEIGNPAPDVNTKDECAINAILYKIDSKEEAPITGIDTYKDPRIVARAMFKSGDTEGKGYHRFETKFIMDPGKTYDSSNKYRLAIISASSADGNNYNGAPGSVLYLDDIEITYIPN